MQALGSVSRFAGLLLVIALLVTPPPCKLRAAPAAAPPTHVIKLGDPIAMQPETLPVSVICDDISIVSVEDGGTFLRITGLRPGVTSCSFGSALRPGRRQVHRFEVRAP